MITFSVHSQFEGVYTLKKRKADGTVTYENSFHNLITNSGLNLIGRSYSTGNHSLFSVCSVGSGNTTPQFTDTDLVLPVARKNINTGVDSRVFVEEVAGPPAVPAYWRYIKTYSFLAGEATGNLSEISVGQKYQDGGTDFYVAFSRALILDGAGTPTTVTVLADEILEVTYELRCYIDKAQYPFSATLNSVAYTGTKGNCSITTAPHGGCYTNGYPTPTYRESQLEALSAIKSAIVWTLPPADLTAYGAGGGGSSDVSEASSGPAYTEGSYEYTVKYNLTNTSYNGVIYSVSCVGPFTSYRWVFDSPGGPTKSTGSQAIIYIKYTWSRYTAP